MLSTGSIPVVGRVEGCLHVDICLVKLASRFQVVVSIK